MSTHEREPCFQCERREREPGQILCSVCIAWAKARPQMRRDETLYGMSVFDTTTNKRVDPRLIVPSEEVVDLRNGPDLYSYLTMRELSLVGMFATKLAIEQGLASNIDEAEIGIRVRDRGVGSDIPASWIEFKVGNREFAFWRKTMNLYEVHDGAVDDDPIHVNE